MTMTELAEKMTEMLGKKISQNNLSQKLGNKSLRYDELIAVCKVLGYKIKFEEE